MPTPSLDRSPSSIAPLAPRAALVAALLAAVAMGLGPGPDWSASSQSLLSTNPDLTLTGGGENHTTIVIGNAAPGGNGEDAITLANEGMGSGNLSVNVSDVWGAENGTAPPEAPHDDTPYASEMPEASRVGLWLDLDQDGVWDDGDRGLSPHDDGLVYVPPSDIDMHAPVDYEGVAWENVTEMGATEALDFRVRWSVPAEAGNAIMTDRVSFNVTLTLGTDS